MAVEEKPLRWWEIAALQDDVIARYQALAAGMTVAQWDWKLSRGHWKTVAPGVAVTHTGGLTDRQRWWAAARRALIREVLDDVEFGAHAQSELEFLRFCRRNGLPEPDEMQVKVRAGGTHYLDARYLRQKVSVEVDGTHHKDVEEWDRDTLRSLQLAVAARGTGEQLIRITRANMRHDEAKVADLLRTLLL